MDNQANNTQQYEKNPNSGNLNPSKFGGFFGKVHLTAEFIKANTAPDGSVTITATTKDNESEFGPYQRVIFKPYTPAARPEHNQHVGNPTGARPEAQVQQPVQQAAPQSYNQQVAAPAQPQQPTQPLNDSIPF